MESNNEKETVVVIAVVAIAVVVVVMLLVPVCFQGPGCKICGFSGHENC